MRTYKLERKQKLKATITEVWDFFSNPENLDLLTPDDMGFEITSPLPLARMYRGQRIEYKVSPILNIPLKWVTEITEVEDNYAFVDEQRKGPYKYWRHKHIFEDMGDHVIMYDRLEYALPFGVLGTLAHKLYVQKRLTEIFDYRYDKVENLFNKKRLKGTDDLPKSIAV